MRGRYGLALALLTGAAFGVSGTFAAGLSEAGWSSGAIVLARVGVASLVLAVPGLLQLRTYLLRTGPITRARAFRLAGMVGAFGLVAVAACQVAYVFSLQTLSVGVALMLEYLGIVLVVLWVWATTRRRPQPLTLLGSAVALAGLVLVLDLTGDQRIDLGGALWGLSAAAGLATYYVVAAHERDALPPLTMAWGGTTTAALGLLAAAAVGALPMHATFTDVRLGAHVTSWVVPVLALAFVATVLSYTTGVMAARRLGATLASFVGLSEVLFAIVFAWLVLGQVLTPMQLAGGALILGGVAAVRLDELRRARTRVPATAPVSVEPVPAAAAART